MKKPAYIFVVSAYLLGSCHSATTGNKKEISNNPAPATDSTKTAVTPPPADTSLKDGWVTRRYSDGVIKEKSYYLAGRRQGECQSFYPNGKLWSDDYFNAGLLDGSSTAYYDNGQKRYEGTYTKGKPSGIWKFYNAGGKLVRTVDYTKKQNNPAM